MAHAHDHLAPGRYNTAFLVGITLNVAYIVVEAVFGVLVDSLALLADAGHNLTDVLGLLLAWGAHYLQQLPPTERRTYGWRSSSILAAMANALILLVAVGGIIAEAVQRFNAPEHTSATTVMWVAGVGVLVNLATALLFLKGRQHDLNIRGAFLHMAADAAVSLGVVAAGAVIYTTGWQWVDPAVSILVAVVIFISTWELMIDSFNLAAQAVPKGIDVREVETYLTSLPGVTCIHDLHIWAMSTTETALTAHLVKPELANEDPLLAEATEALHQRFGIGHITLQVERDAASAACRQSEAETI